MITIILPYVVLRLGNAHAHIYVREKEKANIGTRVNDMERAAEE